MTNFNYILQMFYIRYPFLVLTFILAITIGMGVISQSIRFDVSVDALALTEDLRSGAYQKTRQFFGEDESIVILMKNKNPFNHTRQIQRLQQDLIAIPNIVEADSFINVPLLFSPPVYLFELNLPLPTYFSEGTNRAMAKKEFIENPYYKKMIMSNDYGVSTIVLHFKEMSLHDKKIVQDKKKADQVLSHSDEKPNAIQLKNLTTSYQALLDKRNHMINTTIEKIQHVVKKYQHLGEIFVVGVPVITQDIIHFMIKDLKTLGALSLIFMITILIGIFRQITPVLIVLSTGLIAVIWTAGIMALLGQNITIVSSNFPPLLFVIGLSMSVYIVMRFLEIKSIKKKQTSTQTAVQTAKKLFTPCAYSALTTIVGFISLMISDIKPVVEFGYIMALGLILSFSLCFIFIPTCLSAYQPIIKKRPVFKAGWSKALYQFNHDHSIYIISVFTVMMITFAFGILNLKVENRFIDYFKPNTNIVKGLLIVDNQVAGSTTLEILLSANQPKYWISNDGRDHIKMMHQWLEQQTEIQKVMSFYTFDETMAKVNRKPISLPLMKMILNHMSQDDQSILVDPYLADQQKIARIVAYISDSNRALDRENLISRIESKIKTIANPNFKINVTGIYWLYNNVLQSLYQSQIKTIFTVYACIGMMLLVLFRRWKIMILILIPNIIPVTVVLGTLGWLGIPLDFMTITIAAISVGLSVDFAIQFIYRLREELKQKQEIEIAMIKTFDSIGTAIFTTTVTTSIGFILFIFSNFNPLLYFGLLASLAILLSGIATLSLIPSMIKFFGTKALI